MAFLNKQILIHKEEEKSTKLLNDEQDLKFAFCQILVVTSKIKYGKLAEHSLQKTNFEMPSTLELIIFNSIFWMLFDFLRDFFLLKILQILSKL